MKHKCRACGESAVTSARRDHAYSESGLDNVVLKNIEARECGACGATQLVIPRVEQLMTVIALGVAKKRGRLIGAEIRFLRKSLGWSGVDFGRHMKVASETVSRWENDHEPIGPQSDRLLRLMAVFGAKRTEDYSLDALVDIEDVPGSASIGIEIQHGVWSSAA